ncbi:TRAP transporter 4TM/12TM fusion protein [Maritimibacter alkaliphilus HTCC2654]|uniref:TRAP C4-dicarboxylate transport system permease DctM subunit domain-containing protein n=1 Tax=Maritimibacter alkaliphilus HTCC2654 TaxID=314271 RepID=A3VEE0_9RHOB|nr:TRAP transporter fused permease subunit [Maritimibacter alkaliphilus]EAQ13278.1 hypothetical protein RB2654_09419 [Rhodobacterales bacterium HTCC2654] [Maritimibacter alkaliphilus HTCC2654]TYP85299.1 TRAP transporter 4TM/12TM fusion protein [Maritimibacter alkaliphilus HTCC2654]
MASAPVKPLTPFLLDDKRAATAFAWAAFAILCLVAETIISLKFNLYRYAALPVGWAPEGITWLRLLALIATAGFVWKVASDERRTALWFGLAALALLTVDALVGFHFAPPFDPEMDLRAYEYPILRVGDFGIRVVPILSMGLVAAALFLMQSLRNLEHGRARAAMIAGLLMGLTGLISVLPAIPFATIGLAAWRGEYIPDMFGIGPASPTEKYNAIMFLLAALIVVLTLGRSEEDIGRVQHRGLAIGDWIAFAALGYAVLQYLVIGTETFGLGVSDAHTAVIGCLAILYLCWRVFGAALALCGAVALAYYFASSYLPGIFHALALGYTSAAENLWFNTADAVLGSKLSILLNNVLPFIIFGALLSATGAADSLIKISFYLMRNARGGPAHAAVLASGLFGSVSGSAVSNVVGTGVVTIPMIKKRGFRADFAGGVEATASTGGQIMPPIMGAAALVMADLTGTPYLNIMTAALVPALAYYLSLFATVRFESRRLDMSAQGSDELDPVTTQDYINVLLLVFLPLAVIIWRLIAGASPAGSALTAIIVVLALSAFSPVVRRAPIILLTAIADGGKTFGRLLMVVGVVGIIVGVMDATDLPSRLGRSISDYAEVALLLTLVITAVVSLLLGMGMPTLPAYLTVIIILGPALNSLGLSLMTSHMFVFYFGVASAITPPVAVAAFAAAAIAGAKPIGTGIAAVRIGIVIFAVPFMFALNPDMMIVPEAFDDGAAFSMIGFLSAIFRTLAMIYLFASAMSRFDRHRLHPVEVLLRVGLALLLIAPLPAVHLVAFAGALGIVGQHYLRAQKEQTA